jgi:hypothetical protein
MNSIIEQTIKKVKQIVEALEEDLKFSKPKPSLLAHNMIWFTDCSWLSQIESNKQIQHYTAHK